jgi:hypothetical protein
LPGVVFFGGVFFGGVFFAVLVGNVALRRDRRGCCSSRSLAGVAFFAGCFFRVSVTVDRVAARRNR